MKNIIVFHKDGIPFKTQEIDFYFNIETIIYRGNYIYRVDKIENRVDKYDFIFMANKTNELNSIKNLDKREIDRMVNLYKKSTHISLREISEIFNITEIEIINYINSIK